MKLLSIIDQYWTALVERVPDHLWIKSRSGPVDGQPLSVQDNTVYSNETIIDV